MNRPKIDYYYSEVDKTLFMIPQNYMEDNTGSSVVFANLITTRAKILARVAGRPVEEVQHQIIQNSNRFKHKCLYYVTKQIELKDIPASAVDITVIENERMVTFIQ